MNYSGRHCKNTWCILKTLFWKNEWNNLRVSITHNLEWRDAVAGGSSCFLFVLEVARHKMGRKCEERRGKEQPS